MSKELIEWLRRRVIYTDGNTRKETEERIEELERDRLAQIDAKTTFMRELATTEKERDQLRAAVSHESDCAESYREEADQLRKDVTLLRDALKHAVLYVPELGTVPGISQALIATKPKP